MRPSTPLSASWIVVGADGTEQQPLSPRPGGFHQAPSAHPDDASLGPSELSQSQGSLSLNPEDVEALSSAMLAMGGSASGPPVGLPTEEGEEGEGQDQQGAAAAAAAGEGGKKEEAEVEDATAWVKEWACFLVRRLRSIAEAIVASLQQAAASAAAAASDLTPGTAAGANKPAATMAARRRRTVMLIALPVAGATLAILASLCVADGSAGPRAQHGYRNGTTRVLAASLAGRGLGCCRSSAAGVEGLLSTVVHVDAATPLCVHVF